MEDVEPVVIRPGEQRDRDELIAALVGAGYHREEVVEHRGSLAVRGSIIDVFPSTADRPVRIDLWGDEVDRLTEFAVGDQRSTDDLEVVEIFGCRELLPTDEVRERAERLIALEPWGREQWERLSQGQVFEGMESWLPWLTEGEHVLFDLVGDDALVLLLEPRRMRDRAADLLHEEADLAASLAKTWSAVASGGEEDFPRLHLPFDRLLSHTSAAAWTVTTAPEGPDVATVASMGVAAAAGDPERVVRQLADLAADGYRIVVAADGEGSAARLRSLLSSHGISPTVDVTPLERGCILPAIKLAVIAEHDVTGRRRAHRAARRPRRDAQGFFDDLKAGDYVVHHQHGVARYGGMVKRAIGGVERDYLLLEYKGDDKLYVPSDQIDAVRHYTGGESPTLNRLGGEGWQKAKAKVRSAVSEIAQELVVLYQKRIHEPGHAFPEDTPWQRELEDAFPYQETPDQLVAIAEVKGDMQEGHPMDRLVCGDVGFGKTEVAIRAAFKAVQDGKQVAVLVPTTLLAQQHHQTFSDRFAGYPVRVEVLSPLPHHRPGAGGGRGTAGRRGRRRHRHPPPAVRRHPLQGPRPARGRRGAALRRDPQGADQAAEDRRRRAHPHRHADPAHARDVAHRHPRPHAAQHAAGRPHADPHLRRRVRRPSGGGGHPPRAASRGPGVLRAQPGAGHRARPPSTCATSCPRRGWPSPTGRWTRAPSSRSCWPSPRATTTCSSAPRSSRAASTCPR